VKGGGTSVMLKPIIQNLMRDALAETADIMSKPTNRNGSARKDISEKRIRARARAAEEASLDAARLVRAMREGADMSQVELASALEYRSLGYLSDLETARRRIDKVKGEWKYNKVSLNLLHEVAAVTGCELQVSFVRKQG
jgi:DNA-binding transcriptional regulator YiaG